MGYTTDFNGKIEISPALNAAEINYLRKFNETRRMRRTQGPYFVDGSGFAGDGRDADILDYNMPPDQQPSLWCGWTVTDDGTAIVWDEVEKFYGSAEWMTYLIDTFLRPDCTLQQEVKQPEPGWFYPEGFTFDHILNGRIHAQGEDHDDQWELKVSDNKVTVVR